MCRIQTGKLEIVMEKTNICDLVKETLERLNVHFQNANLDIPAVNECNDADVIINKMRIEQVITNLLNNAIRYGEGKPISVTVGEDQNFVVVSVQDSGRGISERIKDKIFNRFERGVNSKEISGLGLGLFISRQIIHAHKGEIWVESQLGKGAHFIFKLPKSN